MNSKEFSPNSDPDADSNLSPLAEQWLTAFSDTQSANSTNEPAPPNNPKSALKSEGGNVSETAQLQSLQDQLAREELELKNLEGQLAIAEAFQAIQERQDAADEAEWQRQQQEIERMEAEVARQDAEYEQIMADIKRQDAEYEATLAELREQEAADELEDIRFTFSNIDFEFYDIDPDPHSNLRYLIELIGVYADIKPLAIDNIVFDSDTFVDDLPRHEASLQEIQKYLQSLGITFLYDVYAGKPGHPSDISWSASKDPELIKEFRALQGQYHTASPAERDGIIRREGQLLGYPATATEYFIAHNHAREADPSLELTDGGVGPKFSRCEYIHSPEHAEAEYASYEEPLYAAFRKYHPESSQLLDQQISPEA